MDQCLTFLGSTALSEFRSQALAKRLSVNRIEGRYVHYVALKGDQSQREPADYDRSALEELLAYGDEVFQVASRNETDVTTLFVYPRTGTTSPWSSKATSIAHVCGFENVVKRIERGIIYKITSETDYDTNLANNSLHDRMTQTLSATVPNLELMFKEHTPAPLQLIDIHAQGTDPRQALQRVNKTLGLALSDSEIEYLVKAYALDGPIARSPTDAELFMFAQINSEHCRVGCPPLPVLERLLDADLSKHKQFNASWTIDGVRKPHSLFGMIRYTHQKHPQHVISAYSDNAAVFEGQTGTFLAPDRRTGEWKQMPETVHCIGKVETHSSYSRSSLPYRFQSCMPKHVSRPLDCKDMFRLKNMLIL